MESTNALTYEATDTVSLGRRFLEELRVVADGDRLLAYDQTTEGWRDDGIAVIRRQLIDTLGVEWSSAKAEEIVTWLTRRRAVG